MSNIKSHQELWSVFEYFLGYTSDCIHLKCFGLLDMNTGVPGKGEAQSYEKITSRFLVERAEELKAFATEIALLALPMSITSFLIAFSKHYDVFSVLHFLIPLGLLNATLGGFGVYLIFTSVKRMHNYDRLIHKIKAEHSVIGQFLD